MRNVTVDPDLCVGTADCVRIAPAAFQLNEELGISEVQPGAQSTDIELLIQAAQQCPTLAIRVVGDDGKVLFESN